MLRAVAAYKYVITDPVPDHLARLAVVEVPDTDSVPAQLAHWDVTYYTPGDALPANRALYAAHAYTWGDAIPGWLRQVATWVAAAIGSLFGHGHLNFSAGHEVDSHHIVTLGL